MKIAIRNIDDKYRDNKKTYVFYLIQNSVK